MHLDVQTKTFSFYNCAQPLLVRSLLSATEAYGSAKLMEDPINAKEESQRYAQPQLGSQWRASLCQMARDTQTDKSESQQMIGICLF